MRDRDPKFLKRAELQAYLRDMPDGQLQAHRWIYDAEIRRRGRWLWLKDRLRRIFLPFQ